ncbi:mitochondrial import inner membrane translocase subunit Tim54 [Sphaerosporella brunnea]|uniref:Mitochondrial import inner membrane translocase subunit TIM54 n=1 Tax=Sphaerosporella brunnea TaxID=1250544 RepID=A0A5J5F071_9PEZI|nr:mitochondrial import inner membrane translocase subunit Tim54 [Sphaerosporella brunnea]
MSAQPPSQPPNPTSAAAQPKQNPALKAMGLPRLRAKLPSRNWCIFLAVSAVIGGTVQYDRYHTRRVKQKWISAVSHLAEQPLAPMALPRKVTIYLAAPPGDGIQAARDHFKEYVKPVLNAAAVDFEVVEGRQMGELRFRVAEAVRNRRRGGEPNAVEEMRERLGVRSQEEGGVMVVGRHAWKEYLRGLHEGWLGPLEASAPPSSPVVSAAVETLEEAITPKEPAQAEEKAKEEKKKNAIPPPYINPEDYAYAQLPRDAPEHFEPVGIVRFPHILGFFNTPIRMYRFVTRRRMADEICREAAAVALGFNRPFITASEQAGTLPESAEVEEGLKKPQGLGEINALEEEEKDWPKKVWTDEKYKGEWTEPIVVDDRIKERLRKFYVPSDVEPKEPESLI